MSNVQNFVRNYDSLQGDFLHLHCERASVPFLMREEVERRVGWNGSGTDWNCSVAPPPPPTPAGPLDRMLKPSYFELSPSSVNGQRCDVQGRN